jgi:VWFA-related protein
MLATAFAGCSLLIPPMAPVQMPLSHGQLKLCSGAPAPPPKNLASNPNYVEFSVDVIDSTGAAATGLTQADFVATENDRPIPVAYFHAEPGRPPVSIGILVDKSGSMVTKLPVVSASVEALLAKLDPCDEVMLYAFGLDPILVEDFTTDRALVSERLRYVGAGGQTPFYDGVQQGLARLASGHYPDKVAIIFTDDVWSLDNASKRASRADLVASALNSQNRFFVVGVGKPDASEFPISIGMGSWTIGGGPNAVGAKGLGEFASDVGGEFILITAEPDKNAPKVTTRDRNASAVFPPEYYPLAADPGEIQQFATSVAAQIDRHYTIGVISSGQPTSGANQITIKLANRPSARVTFHQVALRPATP